MEEELEEEALYLHLLENQGQLPYYLPQDKEEFLQYGKTECQDLDEHTMPLLEFFSEEMGQDMPHSLILYYEVIDSIQKNYWHKSNVWAVVLKSENFYNILYICIYAKALQTIYHIACREYNHIVCYALSHIPHIFHSLA